MLRLAPYLDSETGYYYSIQLHTFENTGTYNYGKNLKRSLKYIFQHFGKDKRTSEYLARTIKPYSTQPQSFEELNKKILELDKFKLNETNAKTIIAKMKKELFNDITVPATKKLRNEKNLIDKIKYLDYEKHPIKGGYRKHLETVINNFKYDNNISYEANKEKLIDELFNYDPIKIILNLFYKKDSVIDKDSKLFKLLKKDYVEDYKKAKKETNLYQGLLNFEKNDKIKQYNIHQKFFKELYDWTINYEKFQEKGKFKFSMLMKNIDEVFCLNPTSRKLKENVNKIKQLKIPSKYWSYLNASSRGYLMESIHSLQMFHRAIEETCKETDFTCIFNGMIFRDTQPFPDLSYVKIYERNIVDFRDSGGIALKNTLNLITKMKNIYGNTLSLHDLIAEIGVKKLREKNKEGYTLDLSVKKLFYILFNFKEEDKMKQFISNIPNNLSEIEDVNTDTNEFKINTNGLSFIYSQSKPSFEAAKDYLKKDTYKFLNNDLLKVKQGINQDNVVYQINDSNKIFKPVMKDGKLDFEEANERFEELLPLNFNSVYSEGKGRFRKIKLNPK